MNTYFDDFVQKLKEQGSILSVQELKAMKEMINYYKHSNYTDISFHILEKLKDISSLDHVTYGYLTSIHFDKDDLKIINGVTHKKEDITENTMFDIASITNLFTLLLLLRLKERNVLNIEKSKLEEYPKIKDFTIYDLISMKGELRTPYRLEKLNKEKAEDALKQTFLYQNKRYFYSDIPMIIISDIITNKVNQKFKINLKYDEIMDMFLLEPFQIEASFHVKEHSIRERKNKICFDPKVQVLGPIGSAGLFASSKGFDTLAKNIEKVITKQDLSYLYSKIYDDVSRGYVGLYQKYKDFSKTYVPLEYSNHCFASKGKTGSIFICDLDYKIHNHILVDAVNDEGEKREFQKNFNMYQKQLTQNTLLLYYFKEYFEKYKSKDDVKIIIKK